jgi:chromosome segregation ATPase
MTRPKLPSHTEHDSVPRAPMIPPPRTLVPAAELPSRVAELSVRVDQTEGSIRALRVETESLRAEVAKLKVSDAAQSNAIAEQSSMMGRIMSEVSSAKKVVNDLATDVALALVKLQSSTLTQRKVTWLAPLLPMVVEQLYKLITAHN